MLKKIFWRLGLIAFSLFWGIPCVLGQGTASRVTGVVVDQTGAAVPNATVILTNEATNVSFTTQTTDAGTYVFDSVQIGTYTITVEKPGFKRFVSKGNVVQINLPTTVNVTLEVGQVSETVTVSATAELVQTSTSGNFGSTVEQRSLETLPIVGARGRNPLQFLNFQPGVVFGANTGGGVHVNGSRDRAFNFTLDGVDINETSAGGSNFTPLRPNPDMLAEFQIITGNFTAEFGRSSGAQVTLVTRSGTNEFHGGLFEFYRTPSLNANEYENEINKTPRGQFVQHIFGGSLGGPIKKDKTFFFTNLQLLRTYQSYGVNSVVYTPTARQGIFRYVKGGRNGNATSSTPAVDLNGNVLPGLQIGTYDIGARDPQGLGLDPTLVSFFNKMPLPNNYLVGDGLNTAGFAFNAPSHERQYDFVLKVDHIFNERNTMYVRYAQGSQTTICDAANGGLQIFPNTPCLVNTYRTPKNLAVNYRWSPTAKFTNEAVVGFNRFTFSFNTPDEQNATQNPSSPFPNASFNNGIPNPYANIPGVQNARRLTTYQIVDNATYVTGPHTLKAGINFRLQQHVDNRTSVAGLNIFPVVDFSTGVNTVDINQFGLNTLAGLNTNFDLPFLQGMINNFLGRIGNISQAFVAVSDTQFGSAGTRYFFDAWYNDYDFYFQDAWKLRSNLTLDLGLRWEPKMSPRGGGNSRIFRPDRPIRLGEPPANNIRWVEGKLFDDDWNNFAPVVGVAWDPFGDGKTSLRANYRLAYDRLNTFIFSSVIYPRVPGATLGVINTSFGAAGGRLRQGLPQLAPPAGLTPEQLRQPAAFSLNSIFVVDPSLRTPKVNEWGVSFQRELGGNSVLEVRYIGNHGVGLFGGYDVNQVEIFSNGFLQAFNTVRAGGDSQLINDLLSTDSRRGINETGSQLMRRLFSSSVNLGSVAAIAAAIAQRVNPNQTVPAFTLATNSATGQKFSPFFFQAYPQFAGAMNVLDTNDVSRYNALEVIWKRRFTKGVSYQLGYTLAKSMDTRSFDPTFSTVSRGSVQSASSTPFDIHNRRLNYAPSDFDRRHAFQGYFVYDLPFGRGARFGNNVSPWLNQLIGGWELAGDIIWLSGRPFTVYSGVNTVSNVNASPANCNGCDPNMGHLVVDPIAGVLYYFDRNQIGSSLDSTTLARGNFSVPAPGQLGNTGRNFFRGPRYFTLDMTLGKRIRFTERMNLELRLETQNLLNHPSFDIPVATITSSSFGNIATSLLSGSRKMQIAAKFHF